MRVFSFLKSRFGPTSIFVMFTMSLQGCIISGFSAQKSNANYLPDTSLVTGSSTPVQAPTTDPIQKSDQQVIRDKIAAITNPKELSEPLNWDNEITGSQGTISNISEKKQNNQICRNFQTTRAAFDGVNLYRGQVCQVSQDVWNMTSFASAE